MHFRAATVQLSENIHELKGLVNMKLLSPTLIIAL